jgi:hypothetical protein
MLRSHHLLLYIGNWYVLGKSGRHWGKNKCSQWEYQVGGAYRCTILYLVARRCVPTVGDFHGTTIVDFPMSHRWGCARSGTPGFLWERKMCGEWSGLIRNLTALRDLRILDVGAGHATLQIMLYFSWSVLCIRSWSSQWLTTSWRH